MKFKLVESKEDKQKLIDHAGSDLANKFFKYRHDIKSPYNDLYYWLNLNPKELEQFIYRFEKKENLINNTDEYLVYKITSPQVLSNLVGRHILWCIQDQAWWDLHHTKNGTNYYLFINKDTKEKYLLGVNSDDFTEEGIWGENNRSIRDKALMTKLKGLIK